ncbi:MAG: UPF0104 family protein, partial [Clostridia bacterium]|nr:UPF0104 family protein [Clostridia bacterium]
MSVKTKLKLIVGLIVTAVIVYFSVRTLGGLHPRTLLHSGINWWLVVISVAIYMYANYIRGLAYTRGIDPHLNHMIAFQIVGIGHTANMILPLHAGEGLRLAFFPSDYNTIRRTKLLAIPAYADFVAIMMLALLAVPFAGFKDPTLLKALWILSFISIAGVVLSLAIVFLVPRFRSYFNEFLNIGLVKMMIWVILSWILLLLSTWVGLVAFGFSAETSVRLSL